MLCLFFSSLPPSSCGAFYTETDIIWRCPSSGDQSLYHQAWVPEEGSRDPPYTKSRQSILASRPTCKQQQLVWFILVFDVMILSIKWIERQQGEGGRICSWFSLHKQQQAGLQVPKPHTKSGNKASMCINKPMILTGGFHQVKTGLWHWPVCGSHHNFIYYQSEWPEFEAGRSKWHWCISVAFLQQWNNQLHNL